jgi:hypothetical protein
LNNAHLETKKFLEQQLQWSKEQTQILNQIDQKLHHMKKIAEYSLENKLSQDEINLANRQLNNLKNEVETLEKQLHTTIH